MEETAASVFGRLLNVFCFYATVRLECFPGVCDVKIGFAKKYFIQTVMILERKERA